AARPPAGSPTRNTGRLVAACTSATMVGDGASEVMSHAAPTLCIHVPTFDTTVAVHRARKRGARSGPQTEATAGPLSATVGAVRTAPCCVEESLTMGYHKWSVAFDGRIEAATPAREEKSAPVPHGKGRRILFEALVDRFLQLGDRGLIGGERLDVVGLGRSQQDLGVRQLDNVAHPGGIAPFGNGEVFLRLPYGLFTHPDTLLGLPHIQKALAYFQGDLLAEVVFLRLQAA